MKVAVLNVEVDVMKIQRCTVIALLFVCSLMCSYAYADTTLHKSKKRRADAQTTQVNKKERKIQGQTIDGKYYVLPGTICVVSEGIYLYLEGKMIPVKFVGVDFRGVYVNESEILTAKG